MGIGPRNILWSALPSKLYTFINGNGNEKRKARIIFASQAYFASIDHYSFMLQEVGLSNGVSLFLPIKKRHFILGIVKNCCTSSGNSSI